jgi:hypothetical protein
MVRRVLWAAYVLVVLIEIAALSYRYSVDPPASTSAFSINLGWGALISMVVMLVYSIARRSKRLREVARLSAWLHFHIFLGVQGMVLALFHSLHLFTRSAPIHLLNPAVLNLLMVLVVFSSGIFGRYLYSLIPRRITGEAMVLKDVEAELSGASEPLPAEVPALWKDVKKADNFVALIGSDLSARRALRQVRALGIDPKLKALAERRVRLELRLVQLQFASRIFQRWIVLHRPIATIMYVLSAVHVALSYMFTPSLGAG